MIRCFDEDGKWYMRFICLNQQLNSREHYCMATFCTKSLFGWKICASLDTTKGTFCTRYKINFILSCHLIGNLSFTELSRWNIFWWIISWLANLCFMRFCQWPFSYCTGLEILFSKYVLVSRFNSGYLEDLYGTCGNGCFKVSWS